MQLTFQCRPFYVVTCSGEKFVEVGYRVKYFCHWWIDFSLILSSEQSSFVPHVAHPDFPLLKSWFHQKTLLIYLHSPPLSSLSFCPLFLQEPQTTVIHNPVDGIKVHPPPLPPSLFPSLIILVITLVLHLCGLRVYCYSCMRETTWVWVWPPVSVFLPDAAPLCSDKFSSVVSSLAERWVCND